ncbi:MFS transporter [Flavobacterium cyanobacteriorum]|nr:MFS transporter [Flavobacterium cyanobacteriorum]
MEEEVKARNKPACAAAYRKAYRDVKASYLNRVRWAVTLFYFAMGLTFSTWASRISDVQLALNLTKADLGTVLFAVPFGQLFIMPFSGKLAARYGSHRTVVFGLILYICSLIGLGAATQRWHLMIAMFFFGIFSNLTNISVNTQGIYAEGLFRRAIMSSFHGAWSTAGFTGALIGIGMIALGLSPFYHFLAVALALWGIIFLNYGYLVRVKIKPVRKSRRRLFSKPDSVLLWLGIMAFCCMLSEGIMFDWSVIYFEDVIGASGSVKVLGYTCFMVMMALGRFFGDRVIRRVGRKRVLQVSGCLISAGLYLAVALPYVTTAAIAFMMVGIGVSTIVPTIFSIAGRRPGIAPSIALQTVSSVSFLGFMLGPPVIGHIAEATGLRTSFAIIGIFGFGITFLVSRIKAIGDA